MQGMPDPSNGHIYHNHRRLVENAVPGWYKSFREAEVKRSEVEIEVEDFPIGHVT